MRIESMRKAYRTPIVFAILGLAAMSGVAQAQGDRLELYILNDEAATDTCRYVDSMTIEANGSAKFRDSSGEASNGYWSRDATSFHATAEKIALDGTLDGKELHASVVVTSWQGKKTDSCEYRGTSADKAPWYTR